MQTEKVKIGNLVGVGDLSGSGSPKLLRFLVSPCRVNLAWLPAVLCLGGFLIVEIKYYPGILTPDPISQFEQMQEGIIEDWHSPVMTYTWKLIRDGYKAITGTEIVGNGILWTIYNLVLWSGFYLVLRSGQSFWNNTRQKPHLFMGLLLILLFLFSYELCRTAKYLWKDVGFLSSYLMATGLLLNFPKNKRLQLLFALGILFFLFHGTAMRHNAIFAVAPLLCWLVWAILPKKNLLKILSVGFVLWILLLAGIHYVNYGLIKAVRFYPLSEIFYLDIWQLNARTPHYVLPPNTFGNDFTDLDEKTFRENFDKDVSYIRLSFSKINEDLSKTYHISRTDDLPLALIQEKNPLDLQLLKKTWIDRILMDPIPYLKFKNHFFSQLCGLKLKFSRLSAEKIFPVLLFMLISLFVSQNIMSRAVFPWLMLTFSALFLILPLWLFCPDSNQIRYLWWFFTASLISIVYFLAHSPLFAAMIQTVQQYLEEKCKAKT